MLNNNNTLGFRKMERGISIVHHKENTYKFTLQQNRSNFVLKYCILLLCFISGNSMYVTLVLIVKRIDIVKEMLSLLYCSYITAKLQKLLL